MNRMLCHLRSVPTGTVLCRKIDKVASISARTISNLERPGQRVPVKVDPETLKSPIKFSASEAYINYRASDNFYGGDDRDLPKSHNYVLAGTGILGFFYLIILRDDPEADGGAYLFRPLHETVPELAIPIIQAAIAENKRLGYDTTKLEKKLAELLKEPDKHGGTKHKLIEN